MAGSLAVHVLAGAALAVLVRAEWAHRRPPPVLGVAPAVPDELFVQAEPPPPTRPPEAPEPALAEAALEAEVAEEPDEPLEMDVVALREPSRSTRWRPVQFAELPAPPPRAAAPPPPPPTPEPAAAPAAYVPPAPMPGACPEPSYPRGAVRRGVEGLVKLLVSVSAEGVPLEVDVASSSGDPGLDEAAVDAVRKWRFRPARRGVEAVAGDVLVTIRFRIQT